MRNSALLLSLLIGCTSDQITKTINDAPTVAITSHSDGFEVFEGETVSFRAQASDTNNGTQSISVAWYLGQELVCDWATPLVAGDSFCDISFSETNTVVVEVRDEEGAAGRDEIAGNITANAAPEIEIISPTEMGRYYSNQLISFQVQVSDAEDNPEDLVVEWESSLDGILSFETQPDSNGSIDDAGYLSEGQHSFDVRLTDTMGKSVTQSLVLDVGGENTAPNCEIIEPENHAAYSSGEAVFFTGQIQDAETEAEALSVQWISDKDGDLGTGSISSNGEVYLSSSTLSTDIHTITFSGTDDGGKTCSDVIFLTVGTAPIITLNYPSSGAIYQTDENIDFSALVTDNDEPSGQLLISWTSNIDGEFSTQFSDSNGNISFTQNNFSAGTHSITLTVTDSSGLTATNAFSLIVNTAPTAPNVTIIPNIVQTGNNLLATATGSIDADGDSVTYSYQWLQNGSLSSNTTMSVASSLTTKDDIWTIRVTPNDGIHDGSYTEASALIENTDPVISATTISPATSSSSELLTCSVTASDADGETLTTSYTWSNDTTGQTLGSNSTLQLNPSTSSTNDIIKCSVSVADADTAVSSFALTTISNNAPLISSINILGTPEVGEILSCAVSASDADGDSLTTTYSWTINGQVQGTNATITLNSAWSSPSDTVECSATVSDPSGDSDSSSSFVQIQNQAPVLSALSITADSGTAYNDSVLTCTITASDDSIQAPTETISWQNQTQGMAIGSGSSLTLDSSLAAPNDEIICDAIITDSFGASDSASSSIDVENRAPNAPGISLAPIPAYTDSTLTCTINSESDPDGDSVTSSYSWKLNGSMISGQISDVLSSGFTSGDSVTCEVISSDGSLNSAAGSSSLTIANRPPVVSSVTLSPDPAYANDAITATPVASDLDGDSLSFEYTWSVAGIPVQAGSGNSLGTSFYQKNVLVSVSVKAFDQTDFSSPVVESITISNTPPTTPGISISPTIPVEGIDDLVCTVDSASSDIDGDSVSYAFSWTVDSIPYSNATNTSLDSTVAGIETLVGEEWICSVTPNDGTDDGGSIDSNVTIDSDWAGLLEFTNCGQTGQTGPSQSQCNAEYSGTTLSNVVTITSGFQYWEVPSDGTYTIESYGAQGGTNGSSIGGYGAIMIGDFSLTQGDVLTLVVGQQGGSIGSGAGGGATFVVMGSNQLIISGGGGGGHSGNSTTPIGGQTTESGLANPSTGNGYSGAGGGGWFGDGANGDHSTTGGKGWSNGLIGGSPTSQSSWSSSYGGFGGGGGACWGPGSGGGYNGGPQTPSYGNGTPGGAGGGSYNGGSNQNNTAAANTGHGYVIIDKL